MPDKKIYIRDAAIPLFDKAKEYGTSLSKVLEDALREYVERKEAEKDEAGFCEIEIQIGIWDPKPAKVETKKFEGKYLRQVEEHHPGGVGREERWTAYLTKKGNFLLWWQTEHWEESVGEPYSCTDDFGNGRMEVDIEPIFHKKAGFLVVNGETEMQRLLAPNAEERLVEEDWNFQQRRLGPVKKIMLQGMKVSYAFLTEVYEVYRKDTWLDV